MAPGSGPLKASCFDSVTCSARSRKVATCTNVVEGRTGFFLSRRPLLAYVGLITLLALFWVFFLFTMLGLAATLL